jgi:hypothetical protein
VKDDHTASASDKDRFIRLVFPRDMTADEMAAAIRQAAVEAGIGKDPDARPAVSPERHGSCRSE